MRWYGCHGGDSPSRCRQRWVTYAVSRCLFADVDAEWIWAGVRGPKVKELKSKLHATKVRARELPLASSAEATSLGVQREPTAEGQPSESGCPRDSFDSTVSESCNSARDCDDTRRRVLRAVNSSGETRMSPKERRASYLPAGRKQRGVDEKENVQPIAAAAAAVPAIALAAHTGAKPTQLANSFAPSACADLNDSPCTTASFASDDDWALSASPAKPPPHADGAPCDTPPVCGRRLPQAAVLASGVVSSPA